jgi:hypothetical protein
LRHCGGLCLHTVCGGVHQARKVGPTPDGSWLLGFWHTDMFLFDLRKPEKASIIQTKGRAMPPNEAMMKRDAEAGILKAVW